MNWKKVGVIAAIAIGVCLFGGEEFIVFGLVTIVIVAAALR